MEENKLNYTKDETVYLPSDDGCYSIRKFDWNRIKRKVCNFGQKENIDFKLYFSILYGVGASAGFSIIPITFSDNLPVWVTPLYILITFFSIGIAIVLTVMDTKMKKNREIDIEEIEAEMNEVEKMFPKQLENKNETKKLKIIKAIYGSADKNIDITEKLNSMIVGDKLEIVVNNDIAGDPHKGIGKELEIDYSVNSNHLHMKVKENDILKI